MTAYLSCISQNTICKIVIYAYRQWWHLAHYARHISHAAKIDKAFNKVNSQTLNPNTNQNNQQQLC